MIGCNHAAQREAAADGWFLQTGLFIRCLTHRVPVVPAEEQLDLEDGQWEEIHVITGALKLFLRELPEPLFPFSCFDKFIAAIRQYTSRTSRLHSLQHVTRLTHSQEMICQLCVQVTQRCKHYSLKDKFGPNVNERRIIRECSERLQHEFRMKSKCF